VVQQQQKEIGLFMRRAEQSTDAAQTRLEIGGRRFLRALRAGFFVLVGATFLCAAPGCGMFQQQPKRPQKTGPQTVEGWMAQPRVNP
jgi:hypothetical protein